MEKYLEQVEKLLSENELSEKYHCKIKDNSMLRVIDIESKKRVFVKEELCEKYIGFLKESKDNFDLQFSMVNDNNYLEIP
ncbi:hypothetical protein KKF84_11720 [Myxococcota bacterium]|nr:hypothetical protein [Myxococcota bacterium]MBU1535981.1 hypothetical protein [Myxococcota bacterium]